MKQSGFRALACAIALLPVTAVPAYPDKPIQVVVAFPAGGGGDIGMRQTLAASGREPVGSSAAEMAALLKSSLALYVKLVDDTGLKAVD